ncbi:hypothetical protein BH10BAC3_BH10BAC3_26670 [soil metagenome]
MKTKSNKMQPIIMFMYVLLFITATGAFNGTACKLGKEANSVTREAVMPAVKKATMPLMNPLQILTSKFM